MERNARSAFSRLRTSGRITGSASAPTLSSEESEKMRAAHTEFVAARDADIKRLCAVTGLSYARSEELLSIAIELITRRREPSGNGPIEMSLENFLAKNDIYKIKNEVFEALSQSSIAAICQHGEIVDRMFSADSFDVYRALGRRSEITVVLDASVAMPVIFGLAFGAARSRYGVAASALQTACRAHGIDMVVPRAYLNEMASHGLKALEKLQIYPVLPEEARQALRASENAYLSHYSHIAQTLTDAGEELSLVEFLSFFGIEAGKTINSVENKLESLLEQYQIMIISAERYEKDIYDRIASLKKWEPPILVKHDASVATMLKVENKKGFILATWDQTMIQMVEDIARVYADTPAKIIDFLSIASGTSIDEERNYELLTTLLYIDEKRVEPLARKIGAINSTEQAYKLDRYVREARQRHGKSWTLSVENFARFIDETEEDGKADGG